MLSQREKKQLFVLAFACFAVRLFAAFFIHAELASDAADYVQIAYNIMQGKGFSLDGHLTSYRPPAYPFFLAGILSIFPTLQAAIIAQAVFETITAVSLFFIGKNIFSVRTGFLAMLFWTFFPASFLQVPFLFSEPMFTAIIMGSFALLLRQQNYKLSLFLVIGILWGIAVLIKPQSIVIPVLYFGWLTVRKEPRLPLLKKSAATLAGIILLLSPWIVRNMEEFNQPIIVSNGGVNFWIGNNEHATGGYYFPAENNPLANVRSEIERSDLGYALGIQFIMHHPLRAVYLSGMKLAYLFSLESPLAISLTTNGNLYKKSFSAKYRETPLPLLAGINMPYMIFLLVGIYGFVRMPMHRSTMHLFLLAFVIGWAMVHIPFFGISRYHYPLLPIFAVSSAYAVAERNEIKNNLTAQRKIIAGASALFLVMVWIGEIVTVYVR